MTILFRCFECDTKYKIGDDRAGKRIKCKKCGTIIQIPEKEEHERSDDGTAIIRHELRNREFELAIGDSENIEAISDHIETHVGKVEQVFHELISDLVHIDIHWVKPTKKRPFHTLVTSGMSDKPMTVPDECKELEFAELTFTLPPDWPISEEAFQDEKNFWPIRALKYMARLPHEFETWLGSGHTVPNGDPAEPFVEGIPFTCVLVLPPFSLPEEFWTMSTETGKTIHFYSLIPLYTDETEFKLKKGLNKLLDRFERNQVSDVFDPTRQSVCQRKKWFGLF